MMINAEMIKFASKREESGEKMKHIASEFKEILMMRTMRAVPPKPPLHAEEKEEKGTADAASKEAAVFAFEEEEVWNNM